MHPFARTLLVVLVFLATWAAWLVLGGTTSGRAGESRSSSTARVAELFGSAQRQGAPSLALVRWEEREVEREVQRDGRTERVRERRNERLETPVPAASTRVDARFHLDRRRKGLVWFDLYDVRFDGTWTYVHEQPTPSIFHVSFAFPDARGLYDDFRFQIDGVDRPEARSPSDGRVSAEIPVAPGQRITVRVAYASRGMGSFAYVPSDVVTSLRDFHLVFHTDFHDVDFEPESLSPTRRTSTGRGEDLVWSFRHVVTGRPMALVMPTPIQPGELASSLSFSAPISLLFFFLVLEVLARKRGFVLHPLHFAFLAAAFFAFHLLFAYTADHLEIAPAFALASLTSVFLVVTYLRVLVSSRFAFVEAALAQLVYLVGFALAHFAEGFTGLTVTVLAILTLFLLMQWSARADREKAAAPTPPTPPTPTPRPTVGTGFGAGSVLPG